MYSYTRVSTYDNCPRRYKYIYIDKKPTYEDVEAFILGRAIHKGIENFSVDYAIKYLQKEAGVWSNKWVAEEIKIRETLPKVLASIKSFNGGIKSEIPIGDKYNFRGYIDLLDSSGNLYDFKYCSKSTANRLDGRQLNIYRHFGKLYQNLDINSLWYVIVPKVFIRQKKDESLGAYRQRLVEACKEVKIYKQQVDIDDSAIDWFFDTIKTIENDKIFEKKENAQCRLCPYRLYCAEKEVDKMDEKKERVESSSLLPKAERKARDKDANIKMWIYGAPFSGKTTFANMADMPLFLNTDGNVKYIDAPALVIKDTIKKIGDSRMTQKVWGWQNFKAIVDELAVNKGGYKTIVVDLVESMYLLCRSYTLSEHGWKHESDDSLKSWDIIRKEFLDVMTKLTTMDLNVILLSHEDSTREFMSRSGSSATIIKPYIQDKVAKQLAGMVDIVARMVVRDDVHFLTFAQEENIFGGGRLDLTKKELAVNKSTGWSDFKKLIKGEE